MREQDAGRRREAWPCLNDIFEPAALFEFCQEGIQAPLARGRRYLATISKRARTSWGSTRRERNA